MNDFGKQWEGQVVDGEFHLRQYLGGSARSAVFLTERSAQELQKAAIKLVPANETDAELQLSRWAVAANLTHANVVRIFRTGHCRLGTDELLYVVTEFAEEDLSQILPQRALTPAETREMLEPVLDALRYLHNRGLVHGRIKPANLMAVADQLKISSDGIRSAADSVSPETRALGNPTVYDPPEAAKSGLSAAGDVWSLGMTLVEVLTQGLPKCDPAGQSDPQIAKSSLATLPQPFLDIARRALRGDANARWSVDEISARLQPGATPAVAALSVPLSPVPPLPVAKQQTGRQQPAQRSTLPLPPARHGQNSTSKPAYLIPGVAIVVILVAIFVVPKFYDHSAETSQSASPAPAPQPVKSPFLSPPKSASKTPAKAASQPIPTNAATENTKAAGTVSGSLSAKPASASAARAPALLRSAEVKSPPVEGSARGSVLEQVLPDVSAKARDTIHGTVRVSVKVQVDRSGSVISAGFDEPASSKYFGDLALQAARRWTFQAPEVGSRSVPSEWRLRFYFTQSTTKALPEQAAP
jgi:TonB family protein